MPEATTRPTVSVTCGASNRATATTAAAITDAIGIETAIEIGGVAATATATETVSAASGIGTETAASGTAIASSNGRKAMPAARLAHRVPSRSRDKVNPDKGSRVSKAVAAAAGARATAAAASGTTTVSSAPGRKPMAGNRHR